MTSTTYIKRREKIEDYFDRTALDAWKKLTSTEKVSGVRATVRAGRDAMRQVILDAFPSDLTGWRILDAGCGGGALAAILADRGADVVGVDLSAQMIDHALNGLPPLSGSGSLRLVAGDMLSPKHGIFDAVVSMDALIHYPADEAAQAIEQLASRTRKKMVFTLAPRTRFLAMMHLTGRAFPKSDRSPSIEPVRTDRLIKDTLALPSLKGWKFDGATRISRGFYISEAQEMSKL